MIIGEGLAFTWALPHVGSQGKASSHMLLIYIHLIYEENIGRFPPKPVSWDIICRLESELGIVKLKN
jgi:hypothetical protein